MMIDKFSNNFYLWEMCSEMFLNIYRNYFYNKSIYKNLLFYVRNIFK